MLIKTIPVGQLQTNSYLVASGEGAPGAVVDPGDEAGRIIAVAGEHGVAIEAIFLTHGHWDHVGAVGRLIQETGAKVLVHRAEADLLTDPQKNLSALMFGSELDGDSLVDQWKIKTSPLELLDDGQEVKVGELGLKVLHTPGHTQGGMSLLTPGGIFCGDLVFYESVGRTDLPGGDQAALHQSVHSKIMTLPDDLKIYPGHGPETTVGWERQHNPYLAAGW
jgi:hydroxyacylglutathione hydrolase